MKATILSSTSPILQNTDAINGGNIKTCTNLAMVSGHKNQIPERDNFEMFVYINTNKTNMVINHHVSIIVLLTATIWLLAHSKCLNPHKDRPVISPVLCSSSQVN